MTTLDSRVAVVTGGGTGIGRAIATRLASDGARLAILGRDVARLERVAGEIGARAYGLDVRDASACGATFARIAKDLGPPSILVANAGVGGVNQAGEGDRWREIVATNLDGTYFTVRAALAHFASGPAKADIVVVSSILARIGVPGYTAYCASKTGLLGLTRALAQEMAVDPARKHVMVNAICPGWVETEMALDGIRGFARDLGVSTEEARARAMSQVPLGRMSRPEEVAALVAFVVSPACVGMTGQTVDLNNGAFMS